MSNGELTPRRSIDQLLTEMTLAEKVSMLSGASFCFTVPVDRLGIPRIMMSDGPSGARGDNGFVGGTMTSACFPAGVSLASTWNIDLVEKIGAAIGQEAKTKGATVLLGPTVNIHRSPLNGRNFECYSEDPFLTARMAVAYITGLQGEGVGATVKHFVGNDSEFQRNTISSEIDERTLREIYLPPFEAAVKEAKSWAVMAGYNRVNGIYVGESAPLLLDLLKGEWAFDGILMSDWFGAQSTIDAANNGMDLEMPGPTRWRGEALVAAVEAGEVRQEAIDESVRRMLRLIERTGAFEHPDIPAEQAIDRPEHRALIRRAAAEGIVLLKNDGNLLPLSPEQLKSAAVIGPNAKRPPIHGGGSAQVMAHYVVTPEAAIDARLGNQVDVVYETGCSNHKFLPRIERALLSSENGFTIDYFNNFDLSGEPVFSTTSPHSEQVWLGNNGPGVHPRVFSARLSARFTPFTSGTRQFSLIAAGKARFAIDGNLLIDLWRSREPGESYFGSGSAEVIVEVEMAAGRTYDLTVEYSSESAMLTAVRLGHYEPHPADEIELAVALAAASDIALLFVGTNGDWETESQDRPDMELPGRQNELIERVAAVNPRTVVVLQTGSPITMPWLDKVGAVVQAWFSGQEAGNAIVDVLTGEVNPAGRLSQTHPVRLEDNPAFINYPGDHGRVRYGEGIFVGYRYYEKKKIEPLFPFGFGLSYTSFAYANLTVETIETASGAPSVRVQVDVTNTGDRAGQEVVQLYVRDLVASVARPQQELKAFAKVTLEPGETKPVTMTLEPRSFAFWDDELHTWVAEAGEFELRVGATSVDIRQTAIVRINETLTIF